MLFEYKIGGGKLLVSTLNMAEGDPAAEWLRREMLDYAMSSSFSPKHELTLPELKEGPLTYYVAGIEMGEWTVYTDGIPTDKAIANGGDGIISFSVEKGKITLKLS